MIYASFNFSFDFLRNTKRYVFAHFYSVSFTKLAFHQWLEHIMLKNCQAKLSNILYLVVHVLWEGTSFWSSMRTMHPTVILRCHNMTINTSLWIITHIWYHFRFFSKKERKTNNTTENYNGNRKPPWIVWN